ncbi:diaminobutyrate acetyltransferase [Hydrocarboniclastica marina]|uniref:L-2,4-diaminobutyric acid acetyltransferase n=1 Tax=Hydrocarboniclastica marina TaxID=2259620 RepID=A0A4P7XCS3_9ALTE|nr:diaminobutyrate acetyltransferase [Hydrocarboniclastica marina]MAL97923.1 diaminobutyrate acetyltransferase [Alteromonadaceae bacterium]QCF24556.1 diaminobutyrate acetyltransferase [Hydrocarboniclastica marina]
MSRASDNINEIILREPRAEDGYPLHRLIDACAPLDPNSVYCNLLHCTHFAPTSVAADRNGELVGFISGYIPPAQPDTIFIWQVAVHASGRGHGLGKRMLKEILRRPACENVRYMDTTITDDNEASWGLFMSLARDLNAETQRSLKFDHDTHFGGQHDSEYLLRIGPFDRAPLL